MNPCPSCEKRNVRSGAFCDYCQAKRDRQQEARDRQDEDEDRRARRRCRTELLVLAKAAVSNKTKAKKLVEAFLRTSDYDEHRDYCIEEILRQPELVKVALDAISDIAMDMDSDALASALDSEWLDTASFWNSPMTNLELGLSSLVDPQQPFPAFEEPVWFTKIAERLGRDRRFEAALADARARWHSRYDELAAKYERMLRTQGQGQNQKPVRTATREVISAIVQLAIAIGVVAGFSYFVGC